MKQAPDRLALLSAELWLTEARCWLARLAERCQRWAQQLESQPSGWLSAAAAAPARQRRSADKRRRRSQPGSQAASKSGGDRRASARSLSRSRFGSRSVQHPDPEARAGAKAPPFAPTVARMSGGSQYESRPLAPPAGFPFARRSSSLSQDLTISFLFSRRLTNYHRISFRLTPYH
jgi:hypothetical protein